MEKETNVEKETKTKYENTLLEEIIRCDDISLYPYKLAPNKIVYAGDKKGEQKTGCYLKTRLVKTKSGENMIGRPPQVIIELVMERYHWENISYSTIPHSDWKSQGKIFINLGEFIIKIKNFLEQCEQWADKDTTRGTTLGDYDNALEKWA